MNITVIGDRQDFEQAIRAVRIMSEGANSASLNAVSDAGLLGRLDSVWDDIVTALRRGYEFGSDTARGLLEKAIAQAEQFITEAGNRARDAHEALLQNLQVFVQNFTTNALKRIPTTIAVGGLTYNISKVTCAQKLIMTGSIKMNLTEVFSLASNGELEVAVDYVIENAAGDLK